MAQKYTEARKTGNRKWDAANLDRVSIAMPKGKKDEIKLAAVASGESMNQYIIGAIEQRIQRDTALTSAKPIHCESTRSCEPDTPEGRQGRSESSCRPARRKPERVHPKGDRGNHGEG